MRNLLAITLISIFICGCTSGIISVGTSYSGYKNIPNAIIQPDQAIEIAGKYLDESYSLRIKNIKVSRSEIKEPFISVVLKNDQYYIVKDNYSAMSVYFYLKHAVLVNSITGEVSAPK